MGWAKHSPATLLGTPVQLLINTISNQPMTWQHLNVPIVHGPIRTDPLRTTTLQKLTNLFLSLLLSTIIE